ncbi:MAG: DUF2480 family protein [Candidatus Zixiibacteriota bacterium]|jgi:hypothetical protein
MAYEIVDPAELLTDGAFFEDDFLKNADRYDWEKFRDKTVLVRGCTSTLIPPWAYMLITGRLSSRAKSVRFGNEHDNIVVYRREN